MDTLDNDILDEIMDNIMVDLTTGWEKSFLEHIRWNGYNYEEDEEEFTDWVVSFTTNQLDSSNIGICIEDAIEFGYKYVSGGIPRNRWELHENIRERIRQAYNATMGNNIEEQFSVVVGLTFMMHDYIHEMKDCIGFMDVLEQDKEYYLAYSESRKLEWGCSDFITNFNNDEPKSIKECIKDTNRIDMDVVEGFGDIDECEANDYIADYIMEEYEEKIEAPLIKFQASCRRITEIWRYVRTMNELCSTGCGNWR
jgi:hypothetical protein